MTIRNVGGADEASQADASPRAAGGLVKTGMLLAAIGLCVAAMHFGGATRTNGKSAAMPITADGAQSASLAAAATELTPTPPVMAKVAGSDTDASVAHPPMQEVTDAVAPPTPATATEGARAVEDAAYRAEPRFVDVRTWAHTPAATHPATNLRRTPQRDAPDSSSFTQSPPDDWFEPERRTPAALVVQRGHRSGWHGGQNTAEAPISATTPEMPLDPDLTLPPIDWGPLASLLQEMPACALPTPCGANNCGVHHLHPCFGGCACPAPQCVVVNASACVTSPFWLPPAKSLSRYRMPIEDGRCIEDRRRGLSEADGADAVVAGAAGGDDNLFAPHVNVEALKMTYKLFPHRNVTALEEAACVRRGNEPELQSTLFFNSSGSLEFENVCVRPRGRLGSIGHGSWNAPTIGLEYGGFDKLRHLRSWMVPTSRDKGPVRCVLDLPLFVLPVAHPADNHMHVFHRYAAAVSFLEERFGPDFRRRVLVLYVVLGEGEARLKVLNAYRTFSHALSESWVAVRYGTSTEDHMPPFACFNRAYMLSLSSDKGSRGRRPRVDPDATEVPPAPVGYPSNFLNTPVSFPMFGPRSGEGLRRGAEAVLRNLRRCFGGEARPSPRKEKPRLVIAWRSVTRRMVGFAGLAPQIALHWAAIGGGDVRIIEHIRHDPVTLVQAHSAADVVVGFIGTALMWASLLPPGGVVVELARSFGCVEERNTTGWNVSGVCEYGGNAQVFGQQHLTVIVPKRSGDRQRGHGQRWEYVSLRVWKRLLDAAMCRLAQPLPEEGGGDDPCPLGPLRLALGNAFDDPLSARERLALSGT